MDANSRVRVRILTLFVALVVGLAQSNPEGRVTVQSMGSVSLGAGPSADVAPVRLLLSTPAAYGDGYTLWVIRDERLPEHVSVFIDVGGVSADMQPRPFLASSVELGRGAQPLAWNLPGGLHDIPLEVTVHVRKHDDSLIAAGAYPLRFYLALASPVWIDVRSVFESWETLFHGLGSERSNGGAR